MGVFAGPEIVESGLVLALDAGNSKGFDDDENLFTYSEQFNDASWSKGNGSVSANLITAPDGTLTADKLIEDTSNNFHFVSRNVGTIAGSYTISCFVKSAERYRGYIQLFSSGGNAVIFFDSNTGTITGSSGTTTITPYPNGWYRVTASLTFTSAEAQVYIVLQDDVGNGTYTGNGTSGIYIWGAQLERGSSASPYYPTTGTAKNRGTTLIDLTGRGNSGTLTNGPTYSSANGGSLVFDGVDDYVLGTIPSSTFSGAHSIGCWFYRKTVTQWSGLFSTNVGTTSCPILTFIESTNIIGTNQAGVNGAYVGIDLGADHLYKWIYCVMTVSGSTNGSAVNVYAYKDGSLLTATGSLYWTLSSSSSYYVGRHYQGGSQIHNGNIAQVSIYNRALTAAEIQQNFIATRSRYGI